MHDSDPLDKDPQWVMYQADDLLVEACNEAKKAGAAEGGPVEIYSVYFGVSSEGSRAKEVLDGMRDK